MSLKRIESGTTKVRLCLKLDLRLVALGNYLRYSSIQYYIHTLIISVDLFIDCFWLIYENV
mgnify:CR=1 FL=1